LAFVLVLLLFFKNLYKLPSFAFRLAKGVPRAEQT